MNQQRSATILLDPGQLQLDLSPRLAPPDESHIAVLAEVLDDVPPIVVARSTLQVIDGVHRTLAARRTGRQISVTYFDGDERAAFVSAVQANVQHGKPLTLDERCAAAQRILGLHPEWSDRLVAQTCGMSHRLVAKIRRSSSGDGVQSNGRLGRDGRRRPADPAAARLRIASRLAETPSIGVRELASQVGVSPATVMDVRDRLARGEDPVPPKLRTTRPTAIGSGPPPAEASATKDWTADRALQTEAVTPLARWLERTAICDDDWLPYIGQVPLSRLYELIDEARARAAAWQRLSDELAIRARRDNRRP